MAEEPNQDWGNLKAEPEPLDLCSRNRNRDQSPKCPLKLYWNTKRPLPQRNRNRPHRRLEPLEPFYAQTLNLTEPNWGHPVHKILSLDADGSSTCMTKMKEDLDNREMWCKTSYFPCPWEIACVLSAFSCTQCTHKLYALPSTVCSDIQWKWHWASVACSSPIEVLRAGVVATFAEQCFKSQLQIAAIGEDLGPLDKAKRPH